MTLLEKAKQIGTDSFTDKDKEKAEVAIAYLNKEISASQLASVFAIKECNVGGSIVPVLRKALSHKYVTITIIKS